MEAEGCGSKITSKQRWRHGHRKGFGFAKKNYFVRELGIFDVISHRGSQEAIGPLLAQSTRAGEDHRNLWVSDSKPAEHVRHPGTATGLTAGFEATSAIPILRCRLEDLDV